MTERLPYEYAVSGMCMFIKTFNECQHGYAVSFYWQSTDTVIVCGTPRLQHIIDTIHG